MISVASRSTFCANFPHWKTKISVMIIVRLKTYQWIQHQLGNSSFSWILFETSTVRKMDVFLFQISITERIFLFIGFDIWRPAWAILKNKNFSETLFSNLKLTIFSSIIWLINDVNRPPSPSALFSTQCSYLIPWKLWYYNEKHFRQLTWYTSVMVYPTLNAFWISTVVNVPLNDRSSLLCTQSVWQFSLQHSEKIRFKTEISIELTFTKSKQQFTPIFYR